MSRVIIHIKRWNKWRKNNMNGKLHKFLVLIGIKKSITLQYMLLDEEVDEIKSVFLTKEAAEKALERLEKENE